MLCIHQNQSSSFNGPISHSSSSSSSSSSSVTNLDLFNQFNCDEDFQDINLADFSIDVPLDDSLDQMFNNQQSTFDSIGLSSGYSTPSSSSLSTTTTNNTTTTPTPTSTPTPIELAIQLNLQQQRSSSGLSFTENTNINNQSVNLTDSNNNNQCSESNNLLLNNNQGPLIGSTETSLSSTPTTPTSATLPSFMEIYSPRNFPPQSTSSQSLQQQQQSESQSGLNSITDDGSSFFKFDEIGDLNDEDTSLSTVSFGSVSLQKSGQASGSLVDLSFVKQEDIDNDIDSIPLSIQTMLEQQQQLQHEHLNQQQLQFSRSSHHHNVTYPRTSSVASSPGYISLSARSTPNPDHYQQQNYQQTPQQQYHHQAHHNQQIQYNQVQQQLTQMSPIPRSSYRPIGSPIIPNIISSGSNHPSGSIEHSMRSQMNISRSSFSSISGSPNIFSSNSNILGYSSRTSSNRSSPTDLIQISGSKCSKASTSTGKETLSTFNSSSSLSSTPITITPSGASSPASIGHHHHHQHQSHHQEQQQQQQQQQQLNTLCAVCGDNAACQHYGVRTCEGCKGFFKRTVQKGSKYVCLGSKDCPVDKRRRNRCQFCRFQKCLAVGMVKEVVRTDNLKGRRGRLPSKPKSPQESPPSPPISTITALVRAHVDTCPDISNLDLSQYCEINESDTFNSNPVSRQQFVNLLMSSMNIMKNFSDKVPGFNDLEKHDQELLLNSACLEMITLRMAHQNKPGSKKIILPNGVVLHRNQVKLLFGSWFNNLEMFSSRFAQIDIDISAFACLLGLSLITVRHGLVDPIRVEGLQMKIIESLRDHVTYNAEAQKKSHYFSSILSKLPDLRSLSMDGLTHLHEIKLESIVTIPESISRLLNNIAYY